MRVLLLATAALITSAGAVSAQSLRPGQCLPAAEMQTALRAEGQVPVMIGNRVTTQSVWPVSMFTSNDEGVGYNLEGDQPQGTPSATVCVILKYRDLRLNDIASSTIPSWALVDATTAEAERYCQGRETDCSPHNEYVRRAASQGRRVMLAARVVLPQDDGTWRDGRFLTVMAKADRQLAHVTSTNSAGANETFSGLAEVRYTQFAQERIGR